VAEVVVTIIGEDEASQILKQVQKSAERAARIIESKWKRAGDVMDRFGSKVEGAGRAMTALSAPITALGLGAAKFAADFETSLTNVSTLIKGDASPAIAELEEGVKDLLKIVPKNVDDLGGSLYAIFSAGINESDKAIKTLTASSKLAVAGLGETSEATNILTVAINAFDLNAEEAEAHADVLFKTVKNGITTVSQLSTNFGQAAGQAASIGVKFEDLQASTAALTSVTGKTAQAQTQLAALFRELGDDGGVLDKNMQKLGFSTKKFRKEMDERGLGGALEFARKKMKLSNEELKLLFGSSEASFAAFSLMTSANESYNETLDDMINGTNSMNEAFEKQTKTANAAYQIMKNKLTVAMINLGDKVIPKLIPVANKVVAIVEMLADKFDKLSPGMQDAVLAIGAITAVLGPALLALGMMISVVGGIVSAIGAVAAAVGVSVAAILGPIALITAAIGVFAVAWAKNWGDIRAKTAAVISGILEFIDPMIQDIRAAFQTVKTDVLAAWNEIASSPEVQKVLEVIKIVFPAVVEVVKTNITIAWEVFKAVVTAMYSVAKVQLKLIWEVFKFTVNAISYLWETAKEWVEIVKAVLTAIKTYLSATGLWQEGKALIESFTKGIKSAANIPVQAVKDIVAKVRKYLPGSDAEEGPLSDITASGKGMMEALASGMDSGTPTVIEQTVASMARISEATDKALERSGVALSKKELERVKKQIAATEDQRRFANLDRLSQLEEQASKEIALAERHGIQTAEIRKFWENQITSEIETQEQARTDSVRRNIEERLRMQESILQAEADLVGQRVQILNNMGSAFAGFNEAAGGEVKALFQLEKAAALASTIIQTHHAATVALASAPPPINYALAAAVTAKGVAEAAAIASTAIAMAKGGVVTSPTLALIGEAGPEAVIPLNRMNDSRPIAVTVNVNATMDFNSPAQMRFVAQKLGRYIEEELAK